MTPMTPAQALASLTPRELAQAKYGGVPAVERDQEARHWLNVVRSLVAERSRPEPTVEQVAALVRAAHEYVGWQEPTPMSDREHALWGRLCAALAPFQTKEANK